MYYEKTRQGEKTHTQIHYKFTILNVSGTEIAFCKSGFIFE